MQTISPISFDDARDLIQDGDIIFVANRKTITSRIIQLFTKSMFSHCNIAFWVHIAGENRLLCVEAQGKTRRRILNLSFYQNYDGAQLYVVTPPKRWEDVDNVALEKIGVKKYSYCQAMYVGLREFLLKRLGIKIGEVDFGGEICSEFIARVYGLKNISVSPQLLFEELMKTQEIRFIVA